MPTKEQFVGYAGSLAEYFNGVAGNLEKLQKDTNLEIKVKIDEINSLAGEIATLNKQINTIELTGVNANELRDRRTLLMDQLSQIVDVDVTETKIADANNPDRETLVGTLLGFFSSSSIPVTIIWSKTVLKPAFLPLSSKYDSICCI